MADLMSSLIKDLRRNLDAIDYTPEPDPPELVAMIQRRKALALLSVKAWVEALADFASDQHHFARNNKLTHTCFDALPHGHTAQFGELLAREIRARLLSQAEERARDEYEEGEQA